VFEGGFRGGRSGPRLDVMPLLFSSMSSRDEAMQDQSYGVIGFVVGARQQLNSIVMVDIEGMRLAEFRVSNL